MGVEPGYKQTVVDVIPENWEPATIGNVADFSGGTQPPRSTFIFSPRAQYVRLIQIRDYKSDDFHTFIPKELARNHCTSEDIMIGRYGPPIFQILRGIKGAYNVALIKVIPKNGVDREFLRYVLKQESLFALIDGLSRRSSGQTGIEMPALRLFPVLMPPFTEQRAISAALSDVDAALEGVLRLITKKRDLKQATMQALLTGQTRLPGFSGEWQVKRLRDHVHFLKNGTHSRAQLSEDGPVRNLHYGDIHGASSIWLAPTHRPMPTLDTSSAASLERLTTGDLIFVDASEDLGGVGKSVEITEIDDLEVVSGQHTIAARFDKSILADGFKGYLQFVPAFRNHLCQLAAGTKVLATNRAHIASAEMKLPEPPEQTAIAAILSDMDAEIAALSAQADKTRLLKQAMMQELLTGRIRLPIPEDAHV